MRGLVVAAVAVAVTTSACTGLPDSGPVVDADVSTRVDQSRPSDISPAPPAAGASPTEIVRGFFNAMQASPISYDVARQYLTPQAADAWEPEAETITYAGGQLTPQVDGLDVSVALTDANQLGRTGSWQGPLTGLAARLSFSLEFDGGEYRIADPPDALVVPSSWFAKRFGQASLYFFDPSGRILVAEPVFAPRGDQLASTLAQRLLLGPGEDLRRVDRSFLPPGLRLAASSVPVDAEGVASVKLLGSVGTLNPGTVDKMLAQLAWTLGQDSEIRALRVSLGDDVLRGTSGEELYPVDDALPYDPNGDGASDQLFAVRNDVLSVADGNELIPVDGVLGADKADSTTIRTAAVNLDATRAAAVTGDGRSLLLADLAPPTQGEKPVSPLPVLTGTDLLRPAWDFADRTWVVDRTSDGAVVKVVVDGKVRTIDVPGVSRREVRSFLVSRDGTRFVAVVRGSGTDEVRVGRVAVDGGGALDRVLPTTAITAGLGPQGRIRDVAWSAPNTLTLLLPLDPSPIFGIQSITVDGSPPDTEELQETLADRVTGLVGSPVVGLPTYAVVGSSRIDLGDPGTYGFVGDPARSIGYVG